MKKCFFLFLIGFLSLFSVNVNACGEIKELRTDVGTVSIENDSTYIVTVPEGTKEVTLEGTTDYSWVKGFEPRKVSTSEEAKVMVDGNACGYGIYTYYVKFKTLSNIIAEGEPEAPTDDETPSSNPSENPATSEEGNQTGDTPNEGSNGAKDVLPLSKLEVEGIEFDFNPSVREYDLMVDSQVTSLDITALSEDPTVSIMVSDSAKKLVTGNNVIEIKLSDSYGNTGTYVLNILKPEAKSNNNLLSSITIDGYQLNFDTSITSYDLELGKEKMLNIQVTTVSDKANYLITGNQNLGNGSTITIRVTAEDGSSRDYIINIIKKFNIVDYWIYIVIVLLILLILIILMMSKKKKKQKKLGPQELEGQENTAGVVQEIVPQNTNTAVQTEQGESNATLSEPAGTLKIIEPTNIETPAEEVFTADNKTEESDGSTEVFQL